jgi:hypothetical protein
MAYTADTIDEALRTVTSQGASYADVINAARGYGLSEQDVQASYARTGIAGAPAANQNNAAPGRFTEDQYRGAGQWMLAHLNNPALIAAKAAELGLTTNELATAARTVNPAITDDQVDEFFGAAGFRYGPVSQRLQDFNALQGQNTGLQQQMAALQAAYDALQRQRQRPGGSGGITGAMNVDDGSTFNMGQSGASTVSGPVYGPDGRMYSSIAAALAAGVTNYSFSRPMSQGNTGLISNAGGLPVPDAAAGNTTPGAAITGAGQQLFNRPTRAQLPGGLANPFQV